MKEGGVNHLDLDPQITATRKTTFQTSGIGAQQKKKKMAEKITKKIENVKQVVLQSQLLLKPDNKNLKEGVD